MKRLIIFLLFLVALPIGIRAEDWGIVDTTYYHDFGFARQSGFEL